MKLKERAAVGQDQVYDLNRRLAYVDPHQVNLRRLKAWEGEHRIETVGGNHYDLEIYRRHGDPRMKVNDQLVKKYKFYNGKEKNVGLLTF